MKFYFTAWIMAMLLSSCLKQSIPDAMLASESGATATLSYKINGNAVNIEVKNAKNQNPDDYILGCRKSAGYYALQGLSSSGETTFVFYTDSLAVGNYAYYSTWGDMFFISYNGTNQYVHAASDNMMFNITSYDNGHISGNFSGRLTPMITAGYPNNTYGAAGSVLITDGSFQNVPVFY